MIDRVFAPQFVVLYWWAFAALFIHFRGRARLSFTRQISDHSTILAPFNIWMYWFSAVPNKPYLDVSAIENLSTLRDNWQVIRDEAAVLFDQGRIKAADGYTDANFNSFFRSGWKRFYLKWYDEPLASAESMCPRTVALLRMIPSVKGAMFASLEPGGRLVIHRDPYAGSLRYHLGLITPKSPGQCRILVDGEPYTWRDGEDVLFDETFLHYAENTTQDNRIILFCDVERPLHTRFMRAANRWICRTVIKESATQNEAGEHIGALNRLFGRVYHVRVVAKRLKAWNKATYYTLKYLTFGGLLAAVVITAI
jgi:beta-hydroxylase